MSITEISQYYSDTNENHVAHVFLDDDVPRYFIEYHENDKTFHVEYFSGKSLRYVEDAAENWALGIKKL